MAHSHHVDPSQASRSGGAAGYAPASPAKAARSSGPCHCGEEEVAPTCCDTECFERPRYFCGHLLTDADLSLEQRYVIGKQKLYHRALHGHGIVCGLRLTCDASCNGQVIIGDGFAIDDCGNDLVVCEPTRFDVVAALRDKQLLYGKPAPDDCEPGKPASDCPLRQCFYVVACYDEEEQEFATPLTRACGPSPRDCEPTRIRETVRFDVLDKLPKTTDPLADLEQRIQRCFTLFMEGPFAEALREQVTQDALSGRASPAQHDAFSNQVRKLRILFKRYLERHPDHYHCTLVEEIDAIVCPGKPHVYGEADTAAAPGHYGIDVRDAMCRLVDLAYSHVMGCVMGELAITCPEPAHASCIVLGTVEIENERVVQVCNCPRSYVWSFASFWQVAMAKLFGSLACSSSDESGAATTDKTHATTDGPYRETENGCGQPLGRHPCCHDFKPEGGPEDYVRTLQESGPVASDVATALLDALKWVRCSVQHAYAPTRTDAVLRRSMRGKPVDDVLATLRSQRENVRVFPQDAPTNRTPWSLLDALDLSGHVNLSDPLVVEVKGGVISDIRKRPVLERVTITEQDVQTVRDQVTALQTELQELKAKLADADHPAPINGPGVIKGAGRPKRNGRKGGGA